MERGYFNEWFRNILENLFENRNAGLIVAMVAFPLLERLLREKSGTHEDVRLNERFFVELRKIFPELVDDATAGRFWHTYRNGLLHQVTISLQPKGGIKSKGAYLSYDVEKLEIHDGRFILNPINFAKRVIEEIENNFPTFEAPHSSLHPLPNVIDIGPTICGTGAPFSWTDDESKGPKKSG